MTKIDTIYNQNGRKSIPFGAPHTYLAHIRGCHPRAIFLPYFLGRQNKIKIMGAKSCISINFGGLRENFDSTVVCLVAWSLNENEAGGDLVLIETLLLFFYKIPTN